MKIVVINMDKSTTRMESMKAQFERLNMQYSRFSAVNGRQLVRQQIDDNASLLCTKALCNRGMIGCAMSHLQVIRDFLNDDSSDFICVMEDDISISDEFPAFLDDIPNIYEKLKFDEISLFCVGVCAGNTIRVDDYIFSKPLFPLTTACYILSKKGAKRILGILGDKIHYHIDFQLAITSMMHDFDYYILSQPTLIRIAEENSNSTMGSNSKSLVLCGLDALAFKRTVWALNVPIMSVNMDHTISIYCFVLITTLVIGICIKSRLLIAISLLELILITLL